MTLLLSVLAGFLHDFGRKYLVSRLSLTVFYSFSFLLFYVGSKINDNQRALLTQALRFGDRASSSYCSNSGGH